MFIDTSPELTIGNRADITDFKLGSLVEVVFTSTVADRIVTYLGTVAARPEDKAQDSEVCNKYGDERILTVLPTYTIKTSSTIVTEKQPLDDGQYVAIDTQISAADLIFDPESPHFVIKSVEAPIPTSR